MALSNRHILTAVSVVTGLFIAYKLIRGRTKDRLSFSVGKTWDGNDVTHNKVIVTVSKGEGGNVELKVQAPFYNDPPAPSGTLGEPFDKLWDYEVVEAFFLADSDKYLEVELCPHGQHLVLMLDGRRNIVKDKLPIKYTSQISGSQWTGTAVIPLEYFPPNISKFNAYAIHGSGDNRKYEAHSAVPGEQPDFHRLEYFVSVDFLKHLPEIAQNVKSTYWSS